MALSTVLLGGCDQALGLNDYALSEQGTSGSIQGLQCMTHAECRGEQAASGAMSRYDYCHAGKCVSLRSEDCDTVTGPTNDERVVVIGSLFATSGAQRQTNLARQRSAVLAVEEINAAGGVKINAVETRPLALVSCDTGRDLMSAARHLINDVGVSAIVGPNTSQDTLDLATQLSIEAGTVLVSPTAQASSIADLLDRDLSWLMVASDTQRAPLMAARVRGVEAQLRAERPGRPLRLGIVLRDDVLAQGARASLSSFSWNGEPVTSPGALGANLRIDSYDPSGDGLSALVEQYVQFQPDVLMLVGTAETISRFMGPLERDWLTQTRPHYVVTDSSKVPDLIELVRDNESLRTRVTGIGMQPTMESAPNQVAFARAYEQRFGADHGAIFGTGQAYDAVYALALAYSRTIRVPAAGDELARGLRALYGGARTFALGPTDLQAAQDLLVRGQAIRALGSFAPLRWDERGALVEGSVEVWCLAAVGGEPAFASSGLSFDVASGEALGTFSPCASGAAVPPGTGTQRTPPGMPTRPEAGSPAAPGDAGVPEAPTPATPPADAAADSAVPFARYLACGSELCGAEVSEYCCISGTAGVASCETTPRSCTHEFRCMRAADCRAGEQCCEIDGRASCIAATEACPGAKFDCTSARDCPAGTQCCSHLTADKLSYAATRCETACDAATSSAPLCELPLDCAAGSVCRVSNFLPNLHVCEPLVRN